MISKGVKSIFPIKHQDIWDKYKLHIQAFWTPEEVSLQDDLRDLETLNDGEKHFIKHVLAYFANSEAMINENLLQYKLSNATGKAFPPGIQSQPSSV